MHFVKSKMFHAFSESFFTFLLWLHPDIHILQGIFAIFFWGREGGAVNKWGQADFHKNFRFPRVVAKRFCLICCIYLRQVIVFSTCGLFVCLFKFRLKFSLRYGIHITPSNVRYSAVKVCKRHNKVKIVQEILWKMFQCYPYSTNNET